MNTESMPKAYDFKGTEKRIYEWWEKKNYFKPANDPQKPGFDKTKKPFVISIPPPNVTGELHLGHALFVSMEDLMIRYNRMKGVPSLWVPGTDHAGIATQMLVERSLAKENLTRDKLGREEFLKRTWEWEKRFGGIITTQIRRLGASCDWSRERFTLDDGLSKAVKEAFVRLYEKGLIYRGPRLINWSPKLRTAVSDLEVEYSEEQGFLFFFKYVLADSPEEYIPVATTRPETILGDTAVAVHPEDDRYKKFVGRKVLVPILGREIPVIADEYVDREFGTGALKITPAHDPNDYQIGLKHNLPMISIFDETAHLNENGGPYSGQDRFDCRNQIWEDMTEKGLVIKEEPHPLNIPRTQRGGEIVEPMISTQWFVKIKPLAEAALAAVQNGETRIIPERFTKVYYNWLENIQDWCISRQLWWGHRIPVWYCQDCNSMTIANVDPTECGSCHGKNIHQDEDVLDTWFSSGLWPFSTLGWPDKTPDLDYFYPTSVLETGYDIIFFWVARMMMFGIEFTGKPPFHTIYLHGLVRDEKGNKMSKTKGNIIDPLVVMDEFGTDALRFTVLVGSTPGNDTNLSVKKVESNRNFANKLWNAGRFVMNAIEQAPANCETKVDWTLADSWIWARLQTLVRDVERLFTAYQFGEAGAQIYDFVWNEFADWYIEIAKLQLAEGGDRMYTTAQTLIRVFDACLRLLHPFTPFVTEDLWQRLKLASIQHQGNPFKPYTHDNRDWEDALIIAGWPEPQMVEGWEDEKITEFVVLQDVVRAIRNFRSEKKIQPSVKLSARLISSHWLKTLESQKTTLQALAGLKPEGLEISTSLNEKPTNMSALVVSGVEIFLSVVDEIDHAADQVRLEKELDTLQSQISRLKHLLSSDFAEKAPADVVEKERQKLSVYLNSASKVEVAIVNIKSLKDWSKE